MEIKLEVPTVKLGDLKLGDLKPGDCFRGDGSNDFNSHPKVLAMIVETQADGLSYMWLQGKPVVIMKEKYEEYKHRTVHYLGRLTITP